MFKKVFLSTLLSVFFTLLIFTVATAFGAPATPPPSGLASPTFNSVTIGNHGTQGVRLTVGGDARLINLGVYGDLALSGDLNLVGYSKISNGEIDDPFPVTIADDLHVTGKITATSIGTWVKTLSSSFKYDYSDSSMVACDEGQVLVSCGISDITGMILPRQQAQYICSSYTPSNVHLLLNNTNIIADKDTGLPNSCSGVVENISQDFSRYCYKLYAICFDPNSSD